MSFGAKRRVSRGNRGGVRDTDWFEMLTHAQGMTSQWSHRFKALVGLLLFKSSLRAFLHYRQFPSESVRRLRVARARMTWNHQGSGWQGLRDLWC